MKTDADFLSQVPIFSGLPKADVARLAECAQHRHFAQGDEIIREGDQDARLYVVVSGSVQVIKGRGKERERVLATLQSREFFGEMALIDNLVRSATVVAREETEVLFLDRLDLHKEIERTPAIALELLKIFSLRVRLLETSLMNNLGGLLPICLHCKSIRDENGSWNRIDEYIARHSEAEFTHGMCPDCMRELYPQHFEAKQ